ncbi:MAG: hypothetical protein KGJ13_06155 [Patescibacteria group bacterium]|nr:hypothetical protein [Patescibacteria group bacterium]
MPLFSLADLGSFLGSAGSAVANTVTAIKTQQPYQYIAQAQPVTGTAQTIGGFSLGTLLLIGVAVWLFKK